MELAKKSCPLAGEIYHFTTDDTDESGSLPATLTIAAPGAAPSCCAFAHSVFFVAVTREAGCRGRSPQKHSACGPPGTGDWNVSERSVRSVLSVVKAKVARTRGGVHLAPRTLDIN